MYKCTTHTIDVEFFITRYSISKGHVIIGFFLDFDVHRHVCWLMTRMQENAKT